MKSKIKRIMHNRNIVSIFNKKEKHESLIINNLKTQIIDCQEQEQTKMTI